MSIGKWGVTGLLALAVVGCGGETEASELMLNDTGCRNDGQVSAFGETWLLSEPVPNDWRELLPMTGEVRSGFGDRATFSANGVELDLIKEGGNMSREDSCPIWE